MHDKGNIKICNVRRKSPSHPNCLVEGGGLLNVLWPSPLAHHQSFILAFGKVQNRRIDGGCTYCFLLLLLLLLLLHILPSCHATT